MVKGGCDVCRQRRKREDMKTGERASQTLQIRHLTPDIKNTLKHSNKNAVKLEN